MKHINVILQCGKGKSSKIKFTAPLPPVKNKQLERPITGGAAGELCFGVPLVPLSDLSFSLYICPKMKTRPDFHMPFTCIGGSLKGIPYIQMLRHLWT